MRRPPLFRLLPALACLWPSISAAEPIDETLVATRDCPATVAIRRPDNPGQVHLVPGQSYRAIERNRADATHYRLRIDGAVPPERWVAADCGAFVAKSGASGQAAPAAASEGEAAGAPRAAAASAAASGTSGGSMADQYVLAASWQPAFCERRQDRPECRGQTADRTDARAFSLHGLWPQPIGRAYCGVGEADRAKSESGQWDRLQSPPLSGPTRAALEIRMPGSRSLLERHEWTKHGTCYGQSADRYFEDAMTLLDQLNGSAVQDLIEANIGKRLRAEDVRGAFDRAFGKGAGERLRLECDPDGNIAELRIGLKGQIGPNSKLGELILAAPTRTVGCRGGWVDRVGTGH